MSYYKDAIDLTIQTIGKRARYYRNLIVVVVVTGLCSFVWAVANRSLTPLLGILLLVPACSLYFFFDARLLNHWRTRLFESWVKKEIDFRGLRDAITGVSMLPKNTLESMLTTLPNTKDILAEQSIPSSTREAIVASITAKYIIRLDAIAFQVTGFILVAGSIILASALSIWQPLLGVTLVFILPFLQKRSRCWRLRKSLEKVAIAQRQSDFDQEKYTQHTEFGEELSQSEV
jgi:hypothetical protein